MTIKSSLDETQTWNAGKLVHRGPTAYSDLLALGSSRGILLYENGQSSAYEKISAALFDQQWLDDPTVMYVDFREHALNQIIATDAIEQDQRGNGVNGVLRGNPITSASTGRYGDTVALNLDGHDDMVRFTDSSNHALDFDATDSFTLEASFKTAAHGSGGPDGSGPIFAKAGSISEPSLSLRIENGRFRFLADDGDSSVLMQSSTNVSDDQWQHVAVVVDREAAQTKLYLDYRLDSIAPFTLSGGFANSSDLLIGAYDGAGSASSRYSGLLDFGRVSLAALTPAQFAQPIPEPNLWIIIGGALGTLSCNRARVASQRRNR